ncbi:hypothetical protein ACU4GD_18000 [Cupriavidus basilensis]
MPAGLATPSGFISTTGGRTDTRRRHRLPQPRLWPDDRQSASAPRSFWPTGRHRHASDDENADLFWALARRRWQLRRGDVVREFKGSSRLRTVYGGPMLWPMEQARELMKWWRDFILSAPQDINGWFGFVTVPPAAPFPDEVHLQKMCAVV